MAFVQTRKAWLLGGALAAIVIVAVSWFLLISPEFADSDSLHSQADDVATSNSQLQIRATKLQKEADQLDGYRSQLRRAMQQLPSAADMTAFTRQLTAQARSTGVALGSVTVGPATQVVAPAATTPSPDQTTTPASANTSAAATTPTSSLWSSQVTLVASGSLKQQQAFLHALQGGPRTALVTSAQLSPSQHGSDTSAVTGLDSYSTMNIQLTAFNQPLSADQAKALQQLLSAAPIK